MKNSVLIEKIKQNNQEIIKLKEDIYKYQKENLKIKKLEKDFKDLFLKMKRMEANILANKRKLYSHESSLNDIKNVVNNIKRKV